MEQILPDDFDTAPDHMSGICSLSFHPSLPHFLLLANFSEELLLYQLEGDTFKKVHFWLAPSARKDDRSDVYCCAKFNPCGNLIAFCTSRGGVAVFDFLEKGDKGGPSVTSKAFWSPGEEKKSSTDILLWMDDEKFVSGSREGYLQMWRANKVSSGPLRSVLCEPQLPEPTMSSTESEQPPPEQDPHLKGMSAINDLSLTPVHRHILVASDNARIFAMDIFKQKIHRLSELLGCPVKSVAMVQENERVAAALESGTVCLFLWPDIGIPVTNIHLDSIESVDCMQLVTDTLLAVAFSDGTLHCCSVNPPRNLGEFSEHPGTADVENENGTIKEAECEGVSQLIIAPLPGSRKAKMAVTTGLDSPSVYFHDLRQVMREFHHLQRCHQGDKEVVLPTKKQKKTQRHMSQNKQKKEKRLKALQDDDFLQDMMATVPSAKKARVEEQEQSGSSGDDETDSDSGAESSEDDE